MSNELDPSDPDVPATYSIDFREDLIGEATRVTNFSVGAVVVAPRDTGYYYECAVAGKTGREYPDKWPRQAGETVKDGSAVWITKHPDDATLAGIQSAVWTLPAALTKDSQSESGGFAHITVSGGADGGSYSCTCRMTPTTGNPVDVTIVIPRVSQ